MRTAAIHTMPVHQPALSEREMLEIMLNRTGLLLKENQALRVSFADLERKLSHLSKAEDMEMVDVFEAARMLECGAQTIRNMANDGRLNPVCRKPFSFTRGEINRYKNRKITFPAPLLGAT